MTSTGKKKSWMKHLNAVVHPATGESRYKHISSLGYANRPIDTAKGFDGVLLLLLLLDTVEPRANLLEEHPDIGRCSVLSHTFSERGPVQLDSAR